MKSLNIRLCSDYPESLKRCRNVHNDSFQRLVLIAECNGRLCSQPSDKQPERQKRDENEIQLNLVSIIIVS